MHIVGGYKNITSTHEHAYTMGTRQTHLHTHTLMRMADILVWTSTGHKCYTHAAGPHTLVAGGDGKS